MHTLIREENLGCKKAVSTAIDWFFSVVDKGIILEDDCLPDLSFFDFCTKLLTYYEQTDQVMHISGDNFQKENIAGEDSYYFSVYNHIWGWATWRRAWQAYDVNMSEYDPEVVKRTLQRKSEQKYWQECFTKVTSGQVDTWDYQWTYAIWKSGGLSILPSVNLISNIGFGSDATHTTMEGGIAANLPTSTMNNIVHPKKLCINKKADRYTALNLFRSEERKSLRKRARLKRLINNTLFLQSKDNDGNQIRSLLLTVVPHQIKHLLKKVVNMNYRITHREHQRLLKFPRYTKTSTLFLGKDIIVPDAASFLFMKKEIFEQGIYKFRADTETPYILDCGANIGLSIIYFKQILPQAEIVGFEPDEMIFSVLKKNLDALGLSDVTLKKRAVWSSETTLMFLEEGADGGRVASKQDLSAAKKVETVRLREYLNRPVDFLKIDIEGAETEVIVDCEDQLHQVKNMFIEYHSFVNRAQTLDQMLSVIRRKGFRYYISSPGLQSAQPFIKVNESLDMDMQLNIYCMRIS